jgi:TRAP-type transport system periplasmic protein
MSRGWKFMLILAAAIILWIPLGLAPLVQAQKHEIKISVETVPNHPRNMGIDLFVQELVKRSGGRLEPKVYHSAQLYKDIHVTKALSMGSLQMAFPGQFVLEGSDINAGLTMLPMFFGQPQKVTEQLLDGEFGRTVSHLLEKRLQVKVVGRVFEMGFDHVFSVKKKIAKLEDFKGLKIRHAGGAAQVARLKALGAGAVYISWPDVPMSLAQGAIDGVSTTTKSVESAKLHEAGLKYAVETRNFISYYFPMVNLKFWNSLPQDLQKSFLEAYDEVVPKQREIAAREQEMAKEFLKTKGMEFSEPSVEELAQWRKYIMPVQEPLVKELKYDPELVKLAMKALGM